MKVLSATDSIFRSRLAAQTPGQRAADDFLNSPDYWDLVNQGTHPEHRDTEAEFPDYDEDYSVYPGYDEAGPAHDRASDRTLPRDDDEEEYYDEPENHREPEPEFGDFDCARVEIHAVQRVLDGVAFEFVKSLVRHAFHGGQGHAGADNLLHHADGKRAGTNGQIADGDVGE